MSAQIIHREDHNGIPVFWSDIRTTFTGVLTFGVGGQDEQPRTAGVTHLLEHMVMSQVGEVLISHNASTDDTALSFYAQGSPSLVAEFLGRVATSVRGLDAVTDDAVAAEIAHIAAELGDREGRTGSGPLLERYGAATLGLLDLGAPAHRSLTRADAIAWARTWLHSGNAVLTFTGPIPEALDVTLPAAQPVPERAVITTLPHRVTGWVGTGQPPLAIVLDLVSESRDVRFVTGSVLERMLFEELRERRHLVYSVDGHVGFVPPHTVAVTHVMDPRPDDVLAAAEATLDVIRTLATDGPPQATLDRLAAEWRNAEDDSDVLAYNLAGSASRWIRDGAEPLGVDHEPLARVTAGEIRDTIARSLGTLLVSLGEFPTELDADAISERLKLTWARGPVPHYESLGGRQRFSALMRDEVEVFDAKRFGPRRGEEVIVDPERASLVMPKFGTVEVRWDQLVLAGVCDKCGLWDLTDSLGEGFIIQPSHWRGGEKMIAKLNHYVPEETRYGLTHLEWH